MLPPSTSPTSDYKGTIKVQLFQTRGAIALTLHLMAASKTSTHWITSSVQKETNGRLGAQLSIYWVYLVIHWLAERLYWTRQGQISTGPCQQ